jgi:WD40 repeat protein
MEIAGIDTTRNPAGPVAVSPDGSHLAIGDGTGSASLFDSATGSELRTISGHAAPVVGVAFSPDGSRLATASEDQTAKVWDVQTGQQLLALSTQPNPLTAVSFSPDGKQLATGSTPGLRNTAENLSQPTLVIWDLDSGQARVSVRGNLRIEALGFSPDGTRLVSTQGETLKLWDARTGENLFTVQAHDSVVGGVAFSSDGTRIATASRDGLAKVWDASTGNELLSLIGDGSPLSGVAFSPDGRQLATAGAFGIRTYSLNIADAMQLAQARLTRTWTSEECQVFLHLEQCPP